MAGSTVRSTAAPAWAWADEKSLYRCIRSAGRILLESIDEAPSLCRYTSSGGTAVWNIVKERLMLVEVRGERLQRRR